jgi:hypothetical protein
LQSVVVAWHHVDVEGALSHFRTCHNQRISSAGAPGHVVAPPPAALPVKLLLN